MGNFWAYLVAAGVICLTSPIRLVKRFYTVSPPPFIASIIEIPILESGFRKKIYPAEKLIEAAGIKAGMTVVELGCGPGVYTAGFARAIGKKGKLYAVDVQPEMIDRLKRKLGKPEYKDIDNIEIRVASAYELPFQDESIDLVIMVGVLPEIPGKKKALEAIHRILKPSGILAICEGLLDPDYPLRRTTEKYCKQSGYKMVKASGDFLATLYNLEKLVLRFSKTYPTLYMGRLQ